MNVRALLAAASAVLALAAAASPASAAPPYPVSYTFDGALAAQGTSPDASPPGANDWTCRPSARHPQPVVLVHGLLANQTVNFNTIAPLIANDGYCVFSLTYGQKDGVTTPIYQPGGLTKMEPSADKLKAFVDRVLAETGASKVDIVGHSEGSLMPNYYVKFLGGSAVVDDYVGLTTLWDGTNLAALGQIAAIGAPLGLTQAITDAIAPFCESCPQFLQGSDFIANMSREDVAHPSVRYTNIVTQFDELVMPYTSGLMDPGPNVTNHVVQAHCPTDLSEHLTVAYDPVATTLILNALAPATARPVPCTVVLPGVGAPGYAAPAPLDSDGNGSPDYSEVTHSSVPGTGSAAGDKAKSKPRCKASKKRKAKGRKGAKKRKRCKKKAKKRRRPGS